MKTCPNHHSVHDHLEYCEECGSRVSSTPTIPVQAGPPPQQLWNCAVCGTSQGLGRFCEECGEPNPGHPEFIASPPPGPQAPRPWPDPQPHGYDQSPAGMASASPALGSDSPDPDPDPGPRPPDNAADRPARITITANADRAFFDRMQSHDGPDARSLTFPAVYPPRSFTLDNEQIFIGRRSRTRGIDPDIDLSAAPEDSGVSHGHAAIINAEGRWCLVDVGSANGTYLNTAVEPIPANTPMPLSDGDQIHLGAWTTLTVTLG